MTHGRSLPRPLTTKLEHAVADMNLGTWKQRRIAVILLLSAIIGPDDRKIADHLGVRVDKIRSVTNRCREQGLWKDGTVQANWFSPSEGTIALMCDVLVVEGLLERVG